MPIYVYRCEKCRNTFEELLKMSERHEPEERQCEFCDNVGTIKMTFGAPIFAYDMPMRDGRPDWFRDRLKEIHKAHPKGNLNP